MNGPHSPVPAGSLPGGSLPGGSLFAAPRVLAETAPDGSVLHYLPVTK
jgi:hypothetical protein